MTTRRIHRRPMRLLGIFVATIAAAAALAAPAAAHHPSVFAQTARSSSDIRVSANWQMRPHPNPIHGRDALALAVNPRDARHVVAIYADWASLWCETAVSFNGGRTWRRDRLKAPRGFVQPPCTVGGHLANQLGGAGSIVFGKGENVYATFASARVDQAGFEQGRTILVSRSTNGGRSFSVGVSALPGGANPDKGPDHVSPKLAVEPGKGRSSDRLYLVAGSGQQDAANVRDDDVVFTSSRDGGETWAPSRGLERQGSSIEVSQPVIGRRGRLYVAWRSRGAGARPGTYTAEGSVNVARSADRGLTWTEQPVANVRGYVHEGARIAPFLSVTVYTNSTFPELAADPRSGAVYLVYNNGGQPTAPDSAKASDHFIHPDSDVWFQRSTDDAKNWSDPVRLNDGLRIPTEVTQTRQPNVAVAPNGRVDIAWNDRRHWYRGCVHTHSPCLEARLADTYYSFSSDRGRTFSPDRRITDRSINADIGYDYRFGTYWDYGPALAHQGSSRLLVGWMDSRNGNYETDTQSLYLARVDHRPSARVPESSIDASGGDTGLSVELSRRAYQGGTEAVLGGTFATRPWTRVVIVNERDEPSALAAGVLARAHIGPVLLSSSRGLSDAAKDELARLAPIGAYVVGSERGLSAQVVEDLAATGIPREQITRIAGSSRADTARLIAGAMDRRQPAERLANARAFDTGILVNPNTDAAYTAAVLAATRRLPILFAGPDATPAATREALAQFGIDHLLVVGDEDDIADEALEGLPSRRRRLSGRTTERTSRAVIAESRRRGVADNMVYVANGRMESALLGAAGARMGGLQVMGDGESAADMLADMGLSDQVDRIVHVRAGRSE